MNKHDRYNRSEKGKARYRRHNAKRVGTMGHNYLGRAPSAEAAAYLNGLRKEYRDRQNESGT